MNQFTEEKIIQSWHKNAHPWVSAIRNNEIESRRMVTNAAIIQTIHSLNVNSVLDIGCGEGWLTRSLNRFGISTTGFDIVDELLAAAKKEGEGTYVKLAYEDFHNYAFHKTFDLAVCNFSLLGDKSVSSVFKSVPGCLEPGGKFVIQTIHPEVDSVMKNKASGWREGSWSGFSETFTDPAPWYFRTKNDWQQLFTENSFFLEKIIEPKHPQTNLPLSIIFVATPKKLD